MSRPRSAARLAAVALTTAGAVVFAACGSDSGGGATAASSAGGSSAASGTSSARAGDIRAFCPDKPTKAVFVKANGGEVWTATSIAEFMDEAHKCPNLQASAANVTGGQQAAVTAYNAAVRRLRTCAAARDPEGQAGGRRDRPVPGRGRRHQGR
jgi:hypothetical protein